MQYIEIAKLAFAILSIFIDIAKDHKAGVSNSDSIVDRVVDAMPKIGKLAKVKELEDFDLAGIAPELKAFIRKLHELRLAKQEEVVAK